MAKRKSKPTQNKQEYRKQQKRIQQFIRRAEKRGFIFQENLVPQMPQRVTAQALQRIKNIKPDDLYKKASYKLTDEYTITGLEGRAIENTLRSQKVARTLREIKQREQQYFFDLASEAEKDYYEYTPEYQSALEQPEALSYTVYDTVKQMIANWMPSDDWTKWFSDLKREDKNQLERMLSSAEGTYGITEVAKAFERDSERVLSLVNSILYESGGGKRGGLGSNRNEIQRDFVEFASILKGSSLTREESEMFTSYAEKQGTND